MPKPKYKPDAWNKAGVKAANNCYNYATNKPFKPGGKRKYPGAAEPGRASGLTVGVNIGFNVLDRTDLGPGQVLFGPAVEITCKGLKNACVADGMVAAKDGPKCDGADCWVVAYYRKPAKKRGKSGLFWESADYHFVRQDADGKWSHKPGAADVTRKQYNPKKKDFSGPAITDPAKDNVGAGYEFCGYLCVCPDKVQIAMHDTSGTGRRHQGAVVTRTDTYGLANRVTATLEETDFVSLIEEWSEEVGGQWEPGFADGTLCYRLDVGDEGAFTDFTLFVNEDAVTVWDGAARCLPDPDGLFAAKMDGWFTAQGEVEEEAVSENAKTKLIKNVKAKGRRKKKD